MRLAWKGLMRAVGSGVGAQTTAVWEAEGGRWLWEGEGSSSGSSLPLPVLRPAARRGLLTRDLHSPESHESLDWEGGGG